MSTSKPLKVSGINLSFNPLQIQKNYSPRQLSLFAAFWITIVAVVVFLPHLLLESSFLNYRFLIYFISAISFFIATYLVFLFAIKKYVYRRIKLIYKTIHQSKLSAQEKKDTVSSDASIFEEVEKDVEKWAANQQIELEKYKEWAEYRRRFVGDISHELKTPIFVIQGYLDTLLDGAWEDKERLVYYLRKAVKSTERLTTIVQDLEAIAKLESGDLMLDIRNVNIKKITEEVFEELEMKAQQHNIELIFKNDADTAYTVHADEGLIRQVLTNLISNSIKYGKEDGHTKVSFYDMDKHILIEVADNGIGIPSEHLAHVFDRFYRVDKSRSRQRGGSGLGLSIVKHIIEAHEQTINVRSARQMGSTFGFTLEKVARE
ncbi:MAG: ATP-binding protein [Bacteroidota bacterium]